MTSVLLIAINFVRSQRLLMVLLIVYAAGGAALFGVGQQVVAADDILFYAKQQAAYAVLFSVFLAASAIYNERRSRRILAVLSKAIERRDYLAGLLLGVLGVAGIYCLAIAAAGTWLARGSGAGRELWLLVGITALASLLAAAVTLFFTTFLPPLLATVAAALAIALPAAMDRVLGAAWGNLLPVYVLAMSVSNATLAASKVPWQPIAIAVVEILLFWLLAALAFARQDISVALE